jgi:hypothetical protein
VAAMSKCSWPIVRLWSSRGWGLFLGQTPRRRDERPKRKNKKEKQIGRWPRIKETRRRRYVRGHGRGASGVSVCLSILCFHVCTAGCNLFAHNTATQQTLATPNPSPCVQPCVVLCIRECCSVYSQWCTLCLHVPYVCGWLYVCVGFVWVCAGGSVRTSVLADMDHTTVDTTTCTHTHTRTQTRVVGVNAKSAYIYALACKQVPARMHAKRLSVTRSILTGHTY